jgi:hypothetical protein
VRNDLHRPTQIIAATLFLDHGFVDAAGGVVAVAPGGGPHEALVMPQVQVGLGAVVRDEHFAMLEWAHGARIHVDVWIQLDHADLEAAGFKDRPQGGRGDALAEGGNHTAGHEDKSRHAASVA